MSKLALAMGRRDFAPMMGIIGEASLLAPGNALSALRVAGTGGTGGKRVQAREGAPPG